MSPFTPDELLKCWHRDEDCWDCGALLGAAHTDGCDVARCLHTGLQRLSCDGMDDTGVHDCGNAVHDGHWPGERECAEYGWYVHFSDHVHPDLNRLIMEGEWDRERRRWMPRDGSFAGTVDAAMEWFLGGGVVVKTSELDTRIAVCHFGERVSVPRQYAGNVSWALRLSEKRGEDEAVVSDGGARIRLDRKQVVKLADIMERLHTAGETSEVVVPRTDVPSEDSAEPGSQVRGGA